MSQLDRADDFTPRKVREVRCVEFPAIHARKAESTTRRWRVDKALTVALLREAGYEPTLPSAGTCCGLTWITTGQLDAARDAPSESCTAILTARYTAKTSSVHSHLPL